MTRLGRLRARIDRLPSAWVFVLLGFVVQFGVAAWRLVMAIGGESRTRTLGAAFVVGVVVLGGAAVLPSFLLLVIGRLERLAATLAVLVGASLLVLAETRAVLWLFPALLFVAAVRAWAGAGLDTMDLFRHDPGRFDRVEPSSDDPDATDADTEAETDDGAETETDIETGTDTDSEEAEQAPPTDRRSESEESTRTEPDSAGDLETGTDAHSSENETSSTDGDTDT